MCRSEKRKKKRILARGSSCRRELSNDTGCQGNGGTEFSLLWCWPSHASSSLVVPNVCEREHCLTLKSPHHEDHSQDCASHACSTQPCMLKSSGSQCAQERTLFNTEKPLSRGPLPRLCTMNNSLLEKKTDTDINY